MAKERKLAVFDIDGTIFRGSLIISLVEELIRRGVFPEEAREQYLSDRKRWVERNGDYESYVMKLVKAFESHIKGVHYEDLLRASESVIKEEKGHVYRYTRDLVAKLKKQDYYLLSISNSPKTIVELFAKSLGFTKAYGRIYEIGPTDRFTGSIVDLHLIANKANIVKRVLKSENLSLVGSVGVGDTESDIAFLELVEKPICFNPNMNLYRYGKRMKWPVVVERKDVIYEL
jgi:HAD superfamily hydrolase (TIGR01490 family)